MRFLNIKNKNGFTLIELLVVVAIIGLLASIVLTSLSSSRAKGNNAKVKNQLLSIRTAAELYYNIDGNYGATTTSCSAGMFTNTVSGLAALVTVNNYPSGTLLDCGSNGNSWSVAATLNGGTASSGPSWCVDSTGVSRGTLINGTTYNGLSVTGGPHNNPGIPYCL
ncbi:type II secretion system protein [Candidatus Nomurabacteria bacterium]|nr:type II secretion system protein [Candidatus Nomurabacteria bacterium]